MPTPSLRPALLRLLLPALAVVAFSVGAGWWLGQRQRPRPAPLDPRRAALTQEAAGLQQRVQALGQDDHYSWVLIPLLGFTIAGCALQAILFALKTPEAWNARYNPTAAPDAAPGRTQWITIGAIVVSLLFGTTTLMASLAFSFQRYFEYQIEEARKISQ